MFGVPGFCGLAIGSVVDAVSLAGILAYDSRPRRRGCLEWINTAGLGSQAFCEALKRLDLDIAVDLSGHFRHSRLVEFSSRIAAVQATWAGYVGTTGVPTMDWLISDRTHTPDGFEANTTERIARLPGDYVCYSPPSYAPSVGALPFDQNGFITFGCFNNPSKLNESVLRAWAQIMSQLPSSRLSLQYKGFDQESVARAISGIFIEHGVSADRIEFGGNLPHAELLARYGEVDIVLDPWPYSGGLTTLEALWMGVPVLTRTGETFASRHSTAHLSNIGLADWCVPDIESYVIAAAQKARNTEALRKLRTTLRSQMNASAILDHSGFTQNLESAFATMWQHAYGESGRSLARVIDIPSEP